MLFKGSTLGNVESAQEFLVLAVSFKTLLEIDIELHAEI